MPIRIELDDLTRPEVHALLEEHLQNMHTITPAGSVHALDLSGPALRLYESFGFTRCGPFAAYGDDPHSVFMTMPL